MKMSWVKPETYAMVQPMLLACRIALPIPETVTVLAKARQPASRQPGRKCRRFQGMDHRSPAVDHGLALRKKELGHLKRK